tara:strand:+ start:35 stop:190 length:156 start_codon:yes stop_codon:yes gene_type:complete
MTKILLIVLIVLIIRSIKGLFQDSNSRSSKNVNDNNPLDDNIIEVDYEEVE